MTKGKGAGELAEMSTRRELAWPLLAASLWGGMYVVSRLTFDAIPPITLGLTRLLIGLGLEPEQNLVHAWT